jgi:hypothetical protein
MNAIATHYKLDGGHEDTDTDRKWVNLLYLLTLATVTCTDHYLCWQCSFNMVSIISNANSKSETKVLVTVLTC